MYASQETQLSWIYYDDNIKPNMAEAIELEKPNSHKETQPMLKDICYGKNTRPKYLRPLNPET